MKKRNAFVYSILTLAIFAMAAVAIIVSFASAPSATAFRNEAFIVESGATLSSIAERLEARGIVKSSLAFRIFARVSGAERKIQAGTYRFPPRVGAFRILRILSAGEVSLIEVTIPEGLTSRLIGDILEKNGVCSAGAFMTAVADPVMAKKAGISSPTVEGYLFPDTYRFSENSEASEVVLVMTKNFFRNVEKLVSGPQPILKSLEERVILASIVEREYRVAEEANRIASVFLNRLRIGMPLQSCATVVFIITEKLGKPHPRIVYYSDLEIKDDYNTYLHRGLPPGPISNPGFTALEAVFNPAKTDFLYFRIGDEEKGTHVFTRSFDEHAKAGISVKGY